MQKLQADHQMIYSELLKLVPGEQLVELDARMEKAINLYK